MSLKMPDLDLTYDNTYEKAQKENTYIKTKEDIHLDLCKQLHNLYLQKNHDYGDSVHDTYNKYGLVSFLVRMEDKLNRLNSLTVGCAERKVTSEKLEDTLMDLANYALLALVELMRKD